MTKIQRSVDESELKEHATQILRQVSQEQVQIQITRRGQPIARLVPFQRKRDHHRPSIVVWTSLDELAAEIGAHWSGTTNAVDAISEGRRQL